MEKEKLFSKYRFNAKQIGVIKQLYNVTPDKIEEYFDSLTYEEMKARVCLIDKIAEGNNELAKVFGNSAGIQS